MFSPATADDSLFAIVHKANQLQQKAANSQPPSFQRDGTQQQGSDALVSNDSDNVTDQENSRKSLALPQDGLSIPSNSSSPSTPFSTTPLSSTIQNFSNVQKITTQKRSFLMPFGSSKSKSIVSLQLNEKSIYEISEKSLKVLRLIPYETIHHIEATSNKSFTVDRVEYHSDVALQIMAEIKKRRRDIMEKREEHIERTFSVANQQDDTPSSRNRASSSVGIAIRESGTSVDGNTASDRKSKSLGASVASSNSSSLSSSAKVSGSLSRTNFKRKRRSTLHHVRVNSFEDNPSKSITGRNRSRSESATASGSRYPTQSASALQNLPDDTMFHESGEPSPQDYQSHSDDDTTATDYTPVQSPSTSQYANGSPFSSTPSSKQDKLARILGISKDERLNLEADKIILDHSTDEGRTCLQFVKDFSSQFGSGDKVSAVAPKQTRIFLNKVKRYIVKKRGENFEALLGGTSYAANSPGSLLSSDRDLSAKIDEETREKNDAIEKSLERAVLTEPIRKSLMQSFHVMDPELADREAQLQEKLQHFSKATQSFFEIPENIQSPTEWRSCAHSLYKLNFVQYPYEMVDIVLSTSKKIFKVYREEHSSMSGSPSVLSADDLLPLMVFLITRADIKNPLQTMEYISNLMDPIIMSQEEGYYCTLYNSALTVLESMGTDGSTAFLEESVAADDSNTPDINASSKDRRLSVSSAVSQLDHSRGATLPIPCIEKVRHVKSAGGERLFTKSYFPEEGYGEAHIILTHGLHEHMGRFTELSTTFVKDGFNVHCMDLLGHGRSEGSRGYVDNIDTLVQDILQFTNLIRHEDNSNGSLPIFLVGYGFGCSINFGACVERPEWYMGTCFVCPTFFLSKSYSSLLQTTASIVERIVPKRPLVQFVISTNEQLQKEFDEDPMVIQGKVLVKTGCTMLRYQNKIATSVPNFKTPFLLLRSKEDHVADAQRDGQFYDLVSIVDKQLRMYESCHDLLHSKQRHAAMEDLCRWLHARTPIPTRASRTSSTATTHIEDSEYCDEDVDSGVPVASENADDLPDGAQEDQALDSAQDSWVTEDLQNDAAKESKVDVVTTDDNAATPNTEKMELDESNDL